MKRIIFFLCVSLLLLSCKNESSETEELNKYVNEWVHQNMEDIYYWNTTLPVYKSTTENPADYFKKLKYKDDRFSAIFESYQEISNQLNGVSSSEIGFEFQLWIEPGSNINVLGQILYVKPGTSAAKLGIKRGDIFRKINGTQITMSNYSTLINYMYDSSVSANITFSTYQNLTFTDRTPLVVTKATNYQEDPILLDTVYTIQNSKIGYVVYNFFTNDPGDGTMKYDLEFNNIIGKFKSQNITELIVDLRYNHGGAISSAINLSSMLVPDLAADKVFIYTEYNQNVTNYFKSTAFTSTHTENPFVDNFATTITANKPSTVSYPVQNIGNSLHRIYFLTGKGTASASEMVINGLKPFLPCVLIGDTTVGKNVGSTLVYDEKNAKNQWAFLPIILKYFNKDHQSDFTKGFAPNLLVDDNCQNELGDTQEALLKEAISQILGINAVAHVRSASVKRTVLRSSIGHRQLFDGLMVRSKAIDSYLNQNRKLQGK
jgi:carboxyl-terminal processing protease